MKTAFKVFALLMIVGGPLLTQIIANDGSSDTVTDIEGNVYKTVQIGTQVWMAENLKVTKYNDGSSIPNVTDADNWAISTTGAYCNYNNDISLGAVYGRMYNYYAVLDARGICPKGWHIPTKAEWETLESFLGNDLTANRKLKESGNAHWIGESQKLVTNSSGFTALPGGVRWQNKARGFEYLGRNCNWWSTTEAKHSKIYAFHIDSNQVRTDDEQPKQLGIYVRCIKD